MGFDLSSITDLINPVTAGKKVLNFFSGGDSPKSDTINALHPNNLQTSGTAPTETKIAITNLVADLEKTAKDGYTKDGQPIDKPWIDQHRQALWSYIGSVGRWTDSSYNYDTQPNLLQRLSRIQIKTIMTAYPSRLNPNALKQDDPFKSGMDTFFSQFGQNWANLEKYTKILLAVAVVGVGAYAINSVRR